MHLKLINLYPGSWGSNCYLLISGSHAAVVDPSANAETILNRVQAEGARLECILLTHGHFDHMISIDPLRQRTGIPAMIHENDISFPSDAHKNGFYTFFQMHRAFQRPDRALRDGDVIPLGDEEIRVIHTPGHTAGCVCFLCNGEFLLTGDTLFSMGIGRTDLYSGEEQTLWQTLREMRNLPQELPIYPGHGASSTLGTALDNVL